MQTIIIGTGLDGLNPVNFDVLQEPPNELDYGQGVLVEFRAFDNPDAFEIRQTAFRTAYHQQAIDWDRSVLSKVKILPGTCERVSTSQSAQENPQTGAYRTRF